MIQIAIIIFLCAVWFALWRELETFWGAMVVFIFMPIFLFFAIVNWFARFLLGE